MDIEFFLLARNVDPNEGQLPACKALHASLHIVAAQTSRLSGLSGSRTGQALASTVYSLFSRLAERKGSFSTMCRGHRLLRSVQKSLHHHRKAFTNPSRSLQESPQQRLSKQKRDPNSVCLLRVSVQLEIKMQEAL